MLAKKNKDDCMICNMVVIVVVCLLGVAICKDTFAEGSKDFDGAQGVNRSIRTQSKGYFQVRGVGSLSFSNLPTEGGRYNDKPSFYLGGRVRDAEIDAGLQYEPAVKNGIHRGWSAFMSEGDVFCSPTYWDGKGAAPWRGSNGESSITSEVNFQFEQIAPDEIAASVYISALGGSFYYNTSHSYDATPNKPVGPWEAAKISGGTLLSANVKRVTAMTRGRGYKSELDGSELTATWENCKVTRTFIINGTQTYIGGDWIFDPNPSSTSGHNPHLVQYMVDQEKTGYDSPGNNRSGAKDGQKNYIVNFPKLNVSSTEARKYSDSSHRAKQGGVSRYSKETVEINLLQPGTRGKGYRKR